MTVAIVDSIKRLESFFAAKSDPPPRTTSSGVLSPGGPGQQPCTMVHPMHSTRTPSLDAEAQDHSVQVVHPLVPENKAPSLHEGMNASRRSLTGQNSIPWGRVSQVGAKVFHRVSSFVANTPRTLIFIFSDILRALSTLRVIGSGLLRAPRGRMCDLQRTTLTM